MVKRALIVLHRWLGVALCLLFLIWFPSGIAMMYWGFPSVTPEMRLERAAPLHAEAVKVSPAAAWAAAGEPGEPLRARLQMIDGRPVYRFQTRGGEGQVYADSGEARLGISAETAGRIASAWVGQAEGGAQVDTLDDADQWTVLGSFRSLGPLWKYSWANGEEVYVSPKSGEVVQYTTRAARIAAYLGPIPHWLYFTPLRKDQARWDAVVVYTSGIGTIAALIGLVVGVIVLSPSRRYRYAGHATLLPYTGFKRWHLLIGLFLGAGAVTWAYSGMLSMEPFAPPRSAAEAEAARAAVQRGLRGPLELHAFDPRLPREAIAAAGGPGVKELELVSIGGEPIYLAALGSGETRIVTMDGRAERAFDSAALEKIVRRAAGEVGVAEIRSVTAYDRYYLDRHGSLPLPVLLARLNDADSSRFYIDPRTARIAGSYSAAEWNSRWLYHGLHSLDFPWLYNHRPAWDIVVIAFMLGGTALSLTSVVLAWRVVRRSVRLPGERSSSG
jgi:hypothetical protein